MEALVDMGFPRADCEAALAQTEHDVERSVHLLLSSGFTAPTDRAAARIRQPLGQPPIGVGSQPSQPRPEPEPEPEPARVPDAAEYAQHGISVDGLLHAAACFRVAISPADREWQMSADKRTTADICHAHIRPETVPAGWVDTAKLTNETQRYYTHSYVHSASGRRQDAPPPGTRSFCELLRANPATAHFVGKPTHFLSHAWAYQFANLVDALRAFAAEQPPGSSPVYFWYDCFCIDQHATAERSQKWWSTTFKEAIRLMGSTVMMLSPWYRTHYLHLLL
jgi:hypothetical protein